MKFTDEDLEFLANDKSFHHFVVYGKIIDKKKSVCAANLTTDGKILKPEQIKEHLIKKEGIPEDQIKIIGIMGTNSLKVIKSISERFKKDKEEAMAKWN